MTITVPKVAISAIAAAVSLLPPALNSPQAIVMLCAIGLQESRFLLRRQMGNGPARGFWQFEQGGGVKGVCQHDTSRFWMAKLCEARGVTFTIPAVYTALETDDVLAAGAARLLLFTDPLRLPAVSDSQGGWDLYSRTWRPGKPKRDTWDAMHAAAVETVLGVPA